jgi:hypothetical protein
MLYKSSGGLSDVQVYMPKGIYTLVRYSEGDRTAVSQRYAADCPKKIKR